MSADPTLAISPRPSESPTCLAQPVPPVPPTPPTPPNAPIAPTTQVVGPATTDDIGFTAAPATASQPAADVVAAAKRRVVLARAPHERGDIEIELDHGPLEVGTLLGATSGAHGATLRPAPRLAPRPTVRPTPTDGPTPDLASSRSMPTGTLTTANSDVIPDLSQLPPQRWAWFSRRKSQRGGRQA